MAGKDIKIFLDSNVILSGLFSERGAPRLILDLLSLGLPRFQGLTGRYNLIEIERNIKKKMPQVWTFYEKFFLKLNFKIVPIPSLEEIKAFQGHIAEKDVPVLASAFRGKADFLVTGDRKDFQGLKGKDYPFKIVSPSEFLGEVLHLLQG
ncbi:MAG: PIN domain-containing protein [Chlamydiae bacterium]|nr:PIN domain-containing protein [Chlamydiota bacterium]MBI3277900.1 PIN domain-containing protein [Chlamydiota bacterium]